MVKETSYKYSKYIMFDFFELNTVYYSTVFMLSLK